MTNPNRPDIPTYATAGEAAKIRREWEANQPLILACCDQPDIVDWQPAVGLADSAYQCRSCGTLAINGREAEAMRHDPHVDPLFGARCTECRILLCTEQVGSDVMDEPVYCPRAATGDDGHCNAHRAAQAALEARAQADEVRDILAAAERVKDFLTRHRERVGNDPERILVVADVDGVHPLNASDLFMLIAIAERAAEVD